MNAIDVHKFGHSWFLNSLEGIPKDSSLKEPGVCGQWSAKDVVCHITHYEVMFTEVLKNFLSKNNNVLSVFESRDAHDRVGEEEVKARRSKNLNIILEELNSAYKNNQKLLKKISGKELQKPGTIPWYGSQYSMDDFIVYLYYGHKREHGAQINVFKSSL